MTWNAGAEQLNGYTAPEIIGRHFSCFYASEDAAAGKPAANLREATERGRCETQGWRMRKDGSRYWADVVISPVRDEGGALLGFAKVTRDLTERRRADERVEHHRRQLRELAARAEAAREAERIHIAREIHDELGQALTALRIDLAWLRKRLPRGTADLAGKIDGMAAIIDGTADALQRVATELRPGVLDQVGLPAAVQWQASDFQARTGIACQVELAVQQPELDSGRATAAFRILQEALTNVARHSEATRVLIRFAVSPGALELAVQDNGRGITKGALADPRSLGLAGIRERATDLGGTVAITGTPGRGTTVTLSMPRGR